MHTRTLWLVLSITACADPYDVARTEKLAHSPGCNIPFGTPADAHVAPTESVSPLTTCDITQAGPPGFVTLKGLGNRSAYGDVSDAFMPNAIVEPGVGCAGAAGDFSASRAFWAQVHAGLRGRLIVTIGNGAHEDCAGRSSQPDFLSIHIVDWADLDATIAIVEGAMRQHDICSPVVVEVRGVPCVSLLSDAAEPVPDGG